MRAVSSSPYVPRLNCVNHCTRGVWVVVRWNARQGADEGRYITLDERVSSGILTLRHYRQALVLAEELGMRPLQAHCHRGLGTLYAATGQREQARSELTTAIAMYQSMDMTFWLPQTEAALARVEGR